MEPLFHGWYAWSHLIAPATCAMNVANRHVPIMNSYLAAPQIHAAAVENPELLGGPFIDYQGGRTEEIRAHLEATLDGQRPLLELAAAIKQIDELLATEAKGFSLEPLYARVPEPLKGVVELVYDLADAPGVRFIETLLDRRYRSVLTNLQSVSLALTERDHRPFALSTPRLREPDRVDLAVPFASPLLDTLFRAKRVPTDVDMLAAELRVGRADRDVFDRFFTDEAPRVPTRWAGPGVRVRYFGHACVLVETADVTVLVDPTASYLYSAELDRFTYADLPEHIDYVLITHNHQDHFLLETLLQIRHQVSEIVVPYCGSGALQDPRLKSIAHALGFPRVERREDWGQLKGQTACVYLVRAHQRRGCPRQARPA